MKSRRIATTVAIAIMMLSMTSLMMGRAAAAPLPSELAYYFELDGNATGVGGGLPDEWDDVYAGTHNGVAAVFQADIFPDSDDMIFTIGGSKDDLDISNWHWTDGSPPDKNELTNAYAAAYIENGELRVYFGADLLANNGDAQIGFWFFQDEVGLNSDGSFSGNHIVGDVVVLSDFTNGGRISNIEVYEWDPTDPAAINGTLVPLAIGVDCQTHLTETLVCATVNDEVVTAPWPYTPKSGTPGTFPLGTFFEGGINLSEMLGQDLGCFSSFLAETRSSQSVDAVLKDFALGAFDVCSLQVTKDGDERSKVGDPANYTITIENTGSYPIYPQSIDDTLLGDLLDPQNPYITDSSCITGVPVSAGQACTITAARTVQAGDPDPLPNTVTAVFSGNADGSGGVLDGSDYHEVNLFQPGILVTKSGDVHTAQIGDDITYQVTIENTSSADSPALVFDLIDDTLQGDLTLATNCQSSTCGASLAAGRSCTITYVRAIQPGDPSPLVNWVYVESHPDGFPNEIDGEDNHSVTLGDARISIVADAINQVGDPHTFTVKVEKNESDGWVAAEGINPTITFPDGAPGTVDATDCEVTGTNVDGTCLVTINSSVSGVFAVHASADIPAGGLTLHRETDGQGGNSNDAVKTYMTPNISVIKTAGDAADGEVYIIPFSEEPVLVTYHFLVTNSGDTYLSNLTIVDDNGTPDDASDDVTLTSVECAGLAGPLAPGGLVNCTADLWVDGDETNIAVATGNPTDENGVDLPGMDDPTDQDDAIVDMEVAPEVAIDKRLVDMDVDAEWPNYVTFTIAIENVGPSTIDILPLEDEYDPWYLSFVSADPMPEESLDDGLVNWYDLTFAGPNGFGVNLAHGEVFTLTTVFMIMHDITSTTNLAIVRDAIDVYDNTAPEVQDDETIIGVPTAVVLLYFRAAPTSDGILLEWETAMELNNWGFNLYRGLTPDLASAEWIQFEPGLGWGKFDGRQYQYLDPYADPGQTVYYWLADIDLNNATNLLNGPVMTMLTPHRIFLPMVFG